MSFLGLLPCLQFFFEWRDELLAVTACGVTLKVVFPNVRVHEFQIVILLLGINLLGKEVDKHH